MKNVELGIIKTSVVAGVLAQYADVLDTLDHWGLRPNGLHDQNTIRELAAELLRKAEAAEQEA